MLIESDIINNVLRIKFKLNFEIITQREQENFRQLSWKNTKSVL